MVASSVAAVIQARMSSRRFPGKVMTDLLGKPMLGHLVDRLKHCPGIDSLIVATSERADDTPIVEYAASQGILCYRGKLEDVAGRMIAAAESVNADALLRISGDSPLLAPEIISPMLEAFRKDEWDLVTNVQKRSFPKGQSVEIISLPILKDAWAQGMTASEKEHVTPYFYSNSNKYRILNFLHEPDCGSIQLSVDTQEDFRRVVQILKNLGEPYDIHTLDKILKINRDISERSECND